MSTKFWHAAALSIRSIVVALVVGSILPAAQAADTLRPQIGKPLQAAQGLMKAQKYKEALEQVNAADAVQGKTAYEAFVVEQMRGSAAAGAGELDTAAKAFDAVINSGRLAPAEQLKIMQALAGSYYRAKEYGKAVTWALRYQKAGGTDASTEMLLTQAYYQAGSYAEAAKTLQELVATSEKGGKKPTEEQLQLLANCYLRQNDTTSYAGTLEMLVAYYPKKDYWADLLSRVQRKPGFSDRLNLDVYRLRQATGNLTAPSDYMEMAELALQAGYPKEAQQALEQGYASKVLGTGAEADRQKRLKALADKQQADDQKSMGVEAQQVKDADAMVNTGFNLVINGQTEKGLALMQQGIAKGGLKHSDEARLHLGEAYLLADRKDEAAKVFKAVQGHDGSQDLARLFSLASLKKGG